MFKLQDSKGPFSPARRRECHEATLRCAGGEPLGREGEHAQRGPQLLLVAAVVFCGIVFVLR